MRNEAQTRFELIDLTFWGAHAPRVLSGVDVTGCKRKVREDEGVIASTRRVRSAESSGNRNGRSQISWGTGK
jgi:hypothetical protein